MKLNGKPLSESFTQAVELPRPDGKSLVLTIRPLPLAFHARLRRQGIVAPRRPTRIARDSSGRPIKDQTGLAVLVADEEDREYLTEHDRYNQRVAALIIVEALQADPTVEFESRPPDSDADWTQYADSLCRELEEAGWSAGDVATLCDHIFRASNLIDKHLRETQSHFSPPLRGPT